VSWPLGVGATALFATSFAAMGICSVLSPVEISFRQRLSMISLHPALRENLVLAAY